MMTERRQERLRTMIQQSRARLLVDHPEFAMVLMYMKFVATKQVCRISTNGGMIYFDPDWLQKLTGREMDYILVHQALHTAMGDVRRPAFFAGDRYHHACDIILNSYMRLFGFREEKLAHIGALPHETYFPQYEGYKLTPMEALRAIPFDPALMKSGQRRHFRIDSDNWWGRTGMPEDGTLLLYPGYEGLSFEVVREKKARPILRPKHQMQDSESSMPASDEDVEDADSTGFADEEVINRTEHKVNKSGVESGSAFCVGMSGADTFSADVIELDDAISRLLNTIESTKTFTLERSRRLDRLLKRSAEAKLAWRKLLNTFLQEEVCDYSFQPPDRRFDDSEFFLPDFNERDTVIRDVLFMIDSSGSVNDDMISAVYGEICAAVEQFDGKMGGLLSFFNTDVTPPIPFCTIGELLRIRPTGYGGTDFGCIFRYVRDHMDVVPSCIVIFTDGVGNYPPEEATAGIPVLWILHGDADFPQWGNTARMM